MAVIRTLLIKLGFDADTSGADQFEGAMDGVESSLSGLADKARSFAVGFGAAVAGAFGTQAVGEFLDTQGELAEQLDRQAAKIGATREEMQELAFVAQSAGLDLDTMTDAIADLSEKVFDAEVNGAGYKDTIAQIGLNTKDASGQLKRPIDLFDSMSTSMEGVTNQAQKIFVANDLMGESGAQLIGVFDQGAEAIRGQRDAAQAAGAVLSGETLDASIAYRKANRLMGTAVTSVKIAILSDLVPALTSSAERLTAWLRTGDNTERVTRVLRGALILLGGALASLALSRAITGLTSLASGLVGALRNVRALTASLFTMNTAALVLPAAIGLILLALQDFAAFVQGGDSILGRFLGRFREADGPMGDFARWLEALAPRLAEMFNQLMDMARAAIPLLITGVKALGAAFLTAGGGIFGLVIKLAQLLGPVLGDLLTQLQPVIMELGRALGTLFEAIGAALQEAGPDLQALLLAVSQAVGSLLSAVLPLILAAVQIIVVAIQLLAPIIIGAVELIAGIIGALLPVVIAVVTTIAGVVSQMIGHVLSIIAVLVEFLTPIAQRLLDFWGLVSTAVQAFLGLIFLGFKAAFDAIMVVVGPVLDAINRAIQGASAVARIGIGSSESSSGALSAVSRAGAGRTLASAAARSPGAGSGGGDRNLSVNGLNITLQGSPDLTVQEAQAMIGGAVASGVDEADRIAAGREVL